MGRFIGSSDMPTYVRYTYYSLGWLLGCTYCLCAQLPEESVVFVQIGYEENHVFIPVEDASGFIVQEEGWVLTAKHALTAAVPENKVREFYGSVGSRYGDKYRLFEVPGPVVSSDFGLLRFSPALRKKWPALGVLINRKLAKSDNVEAFGFPIGYDLTERKGIVTDTFAPDGTMGTNAGLAPGMSGGPVVLESTSCVVGIVTGGTNFAGFDRFSPMLLAKTLLDVPPAQPCGDPKAPAAAWKTCENQAFGLAAWGNEETLNGTSGWRGEGYNQGAYCTEFTNSVIQARGLGDKPHVVDNVRSSEENRRTGFEFCGTIQLSLLDRSTLDSCI